MREGLEAFDSKMGQISEKMEELIKLERQARDLVNLLKNEMVKDVQEVRLPGVTIAETPSGGCFAVVKFSEFKTHNWSPRTYIPREMAKQDAPIREKDFRCGIGLSFCRDPIDKRGSDVI